MHPFDPGTLSDLEVAPGTWELGLARLEHGDLRLALMVVWNTVTGRPRATAPEGTGPLDLAMAAMLDPMPPEAPARPEAMVCTSARVAMALTSLHDHVRIRVGATPLLEALRQLPPDESESPFHVPGLRLDEWRTVTAEVGRPPWSWFGAELEMVFEGGALDGWAADLDGVGGLQLYEDTEEQHAARRMVVPRGITVRGVAFAQLAEVEPDQRRKYHEAGLVVAERVPVLTKVEGLEGHRIEADDEGRLLDALLAGIEIVKRHARRIRSGEVVTDPVDLPSGTITVTANVDPELADLPPESLTSLIRADHRTTVEPVGARDPKRPTVVLTLDENDDGDAARIVSRLSLLQAVLDEASDRTVLVAFSASEREALGVLASLPPEDRERLGEAGEALVAVEAPGLVTTRTVLLQHR